VSDSVPEITNQAISKAKIGIDCYLNNDFSTVIDPERLSLKLLESKRKGLKLRMISDISTKDSSLYRRFVIYFEIRHIDKISCNMILIDRSNFMTFLTSGSNKTRLLRIADKSFVSAQQFLFDSLWNVALPFKEKIKEIEYGHGKSFAKNISRSSEILDTIRTSIISSIDEVLILFSEYEVLIHSKKLGILKLLQEVTRNGIKVRIIVHCENKNIKEKLKNIFIENFPDVSVQYLQKSLQTKMTTMIFDRRTFLDISTEARFDENSERVMGPSVYSNNEIKLNSLISIFEFLWIQSDIDNQKIIKEAYFKLFKGFNLRDETYKRDWTFKTNKQRK
jgi:predicted DNA-binding antitoxin AbrB/MazE fold protein